jgi:hypothetical protein
LESWTDTTNPEAGSGGLLVYGIDDFGIRNRIKFDVEFAAVRT